MDNLMEENLGTVASEISKESTNIDFSNVGIFGLGVVAGVAIKSFGDTVVIPFITGKLKKTKKNKKKLEEIERVEDEEDEEEEELEEEEDEEDEE